MTPRPALVLVPFVLGACDVHSTVGYIDGALVGGASLKVSDFAAIVRAA